MKKLYKVRILAVVLTISSVLSLGSISAFATENTDDYISVLVEHGYTKETAEVLPAEDQKEIAEKLLTNPDDVDITTLSMEVDMLSEVESFFEYSEEELIAMGATEEKIVKTREELLYYYGLSNDDLSKELDVNETEAAMLKQAIAAGMESNENPSSKKCGVTASGSITSSEMTYTQSVTNNSTSSAPSYAVKLSYTWKEVYALAVFSDEIVAAWGGGLNTKSISSSAKYYNWSTIGGSFGTYYTSKSMSKTETVQAGIEFKFPQSVYKDLSSNCPKTKTGYAKFTLYQTKFQGYDTKVLSNYCHKVISVGGGSISISASGPSVSLSIGSGYDKTAQKASTIKY